MGKLTMQNILLLCLVFNTNCFTHVPSDDYDEEGETVGERDLLSNICWLSLQTDIFEPTFYWHPNNGLAEIITSAHAKLIPAEKDLFIIAHGFTQNYNSKMGNVTFKGLIRALLTAHPSATVLFVDWSQGSLSGSSCQKMCYPRAARNTKRAGERTARFLELIPDFDPHKVYCIGFSLGAHVCGFIAKHMASGSKINRITGLDPAGPCFKDVSESMRLDKSDANFVDIIHTNTAKLGLNAAIGHVDFWPNGGRRQPSCDDGPSSEDIMQRIDWYDIIGLFSGCSHSRAMEYYYQSVSPLKHHCFPMCPIGSNSCQSKHGTLMGYFADRNPSPGQYEGKTESRHPFLVRNANFCSNQPKNKSFSENYNVLDSGFLPDYL